MRRKANRDKPERAIVSALRAYGCSVEFLDLAGGPDLLVGVGGRNLLMEVKSPPGPRGGSRADGQRLSARQEAWRQAWKGQYVVVHTVEEALLLAHSLEGA